MAKISSTSFYSEYHGHKLRHLEVLYPPLRRNSDALIWTAGDSSLDNKHWFADQRPAVGVYADILQPPRSVCDVTYWLNSLSESDDRYRFAKNNVDGSSDSNSGSGRDGGRDDGRGNVKYAAINTAVEATTLNERCAKLRPQDKFLRDNIGEEDVLIVSIGGNDIALYPTPATIAAVAGLLCLPNSCLESGRSFGAVPLNDCCCGCGPSLASCTCSCPPCFGYFRHLFGTSNNSKDKPKKILVCMIYYPDENNTPSWANAALGSLVTIPTRPKFNCYSESFSKRRQGSQVIPIPLFHPLDGTKSEDYVARVEPSASGGRKMAEYMLDVIHHHSSSGMDNGAVGGAMGTMTTTTSGFSSAPSTSFMDGRA